MRFIMFIALLALAASAGAQMPVADSSHLDAWANFRLMAMYFLGGASLVFSIAIIARAIIGRRQRAAVLPAEEWPDMEADFARMEERVENLTTILSERN